MIRFEQVVSSSLAVPRIAAGEIHLWAFGLNPRGEKVEELAACLCSDERERSDRFRSERDRRHFKVRRGFLRSLLCRYLACPKEEIRFGRGSGGKPFLIEHPELFFNLSHSGELALIAVSCDAELGVDIEQLRAVEDADAIVRRLFSPGEGVAYFDAAISTRPVVFFNCWTRKEAFVKARGDGLSFPLKHFEVSVTPEEPARVLTIRGNPTSAAAGR